MNKHFTPLLVKISICIACLLSAVALKAQTVKNNQIVIGIVDSVYSKILGENRKIWVYNPPTSPDDSFYAKQHYPVLYLLDGNVHFSSVVGMMQQFSEAYGNSVCPKMIIVAIPNTDRNRDLTPTNAPPDSTSGGAEKFTAFIKTELMTHIDSVYPTAPYKTLIGHSYGGLFTINTLVNHPEMFNAYVAIDPSMWYDNQKLLYQAQEALSKKNYTGKSLFIGFANNMPQGIDTAKVRQDTTEFTRHTRDILILKDWVKKTQGANGLAFDYKYYNNDTHGTVPLITEYDAMHFLFKDYNFDYKIFLKIVMEKSVIDADSTIKAITKQYDNISRQAGCKITPPEPIVNSLGFTALNLGIPKLAFAFFSMNTQNYPTSFNVYFAMGEYYTHEKDNAKAIEYCKKALAIKEYHETRAKLNKLLAGK